MATLVALVPKHRWDVNMLNFTNHINWPLLGPLSFASSNLPETTCGISQLMCSPNGPPHMQSKLHKVQRYLLTIKNRLGTMVMVFQYCWKSHQLCPETTQRKSIAYLFCHITMAQNRSLGSRLQPMLHWHVSLNRSWSIWIGYRNESESVEILTWTNQPAENSRGQSNQHIMGTSTVRSVCDSIVYICVCVRL